MYKTIDNYCHNENDNGLILIDLPTGAGKTFAVLNFIYDSAINPDNKEKKYFFVTTLKKNLPIREIKERFVKHKAEAQFKEKFLFLDSNTEMVVTNLSNDVIKFIPEDIKKSEEYKDFQHAIKMVQKYQKGKTDFELKGIVADINEDLRIHKEPKFRRMVESLLSKEYKTTEQKIYAIKTDEKWKWLGELYPSVFTRDKQIIFLSMDKLIARNSTIVEPSYQFFSSDIINNSVIFIDEFDATKETVLKNLITNGVEERIDYIDLFNSIYSSLHYHEFPKPLTTPSSQRENSEYKGKTLVDVLDGVTEKADDIYKTYALQFSHKTTDNEANVSKNFLFQDHQFKSILDGNKKYISIVTDKESKINRISFVDDKPALEKENIQFLLGKLRGFISFFSNAVKILAINYMQCMQERRKKDEDEFTYEQSIKSVLNEFQLGATYVDFLTSYILMSTGSRKVKVNNEDFDLTFYQKGFRYYAFEDSPEHDMNSKIMMYSFQTTPEKLMLKFCEKAKVVGISATASLHSVIGNYDLEYFKTKLEDKFCECTNEDKNRMANNFKESTSHYDQVNIEPELIGNRQDEYGINWWEDVFDNEEIREYIFNAIENDVPQDKKNALFCKQRYYRIAVAYKKFIEHSDINSFLCILNKHPKENDSTLNKNILSAIFDCIAGPEPLYNAKNCVRYLTGDDYDNNKDSIIKELEKGKKLFVISVYQTIGAGQNLQYKIPKGVENNLVQINDWKDRNKEKDFDAIYLDRPTNMVVNLGNNLDNESFVKYLYQIEFLQEHDEISLDDVKKHIKKAFKTYTTQHAQFEKVSNLYETDSVKNYCTKAIIQAVGRICRTNTKNRNIYIFAESQIRDFIDPSIIKGRLLNQEFVKLYELLDIEEKKSNEILLLENKANKISVKANGYIKNILQEDWDNKKMENWKRLREVSLMYPTISSENKNVDTLIKNFYIKLPAPGNMYYYYQTSDFNNVNVSFTKDDQCVTEASFAASNLEALMSSKMLKTYFEEKGWATEFDKNDLMMCPTMFNNIYKGALGETVGRYVFEEVIKEELLDITEPKEFELFDYRIKDVPIYIDFKNWHESTDFDDKRTIEKIKKKAGEYEDCRCVIIVNVLAKEGFKQRTIKSDEIEIVTVPSLFVRKTNGIDINREAIKLISAKINEYKN